MNLSCRVLDKQGQPIPGLYAVGELTGVGGINGKAALEGTFLGPGVLMGRIAAQAVLAELRIKSEPVARSDAQPEPPPAGTGPEESSACLTCHDLPSLIGGSRRGYWHFERVHDVVLKRQNECNQCHAELAPYREAAHRMNPLAQIANCAACHLAY